MIFVIAAVSMAMSQHDLLQQQGKQRQSFCLTPMPWAICWYWGWGREKSYGFQLSTLLPCLKYKEKSIKATTVLRSPSCDPGACTHVPTRHSIPTVRAWQISLSTPRCPSIRSSERGRLSSGHWAELGAAAAPGFTLGWLSGQWLHIEGQVA